MTYGPQIVAQIFRLGQEAEVKVRKETGTNEFGNEIDEHVTDRTVIAFRTYPNRNTEHESRVGDLDQDRPVFLVPKGPNQADPPGGDDVLVYDGQEYEVKAHTPYDTHVEFFGEPIIHG